MDAFYMHQRQLLLLCRRRGPRITRLLEGPAASHHGDAETWEAKTT
jgi:hypothetical protein